MTLTAEGLEIPSTLDILDRMSGDQRATIDPLLPTDPISIVGSHNGIYASQEREVWEVLQILFSSLDYRKAEGALLDGLLALRGSAREPAKRSRFTGTRRLLVTLAAGQSVTAGVNLFGIPGTDIEFQATSSASNPGPGTLDYLISAECTVEGPVTAPAGTVTAVVTPGPTAVTNPYDAVLGEPIELDDDFRNRSDGELARPGSGTVRALPADMLAIRNDDDSAPVRAVEIIENLTMTNGVNGLRARSYEVVIWDGPAQEAQNSAIEAVMAANRVPGMFGIYSRPGQLATTVELEIVVGTGYAGDDAVKAAVVAYFDTLGPSIDTRTGIVSWSKISDAVDDVAGIERVDQITITIDGGAPVVNGNARPGVRQVATIQLADITITHV